MKLRTWFILIMILGACKDKYMPHINQPASGFLVVEGYINSGNDSTFIYLSRSSAIGQHSGISGTRRPDRSSV